MMDITGVGNNPLNKPRRPEKFKIQIFIKSDQLQILTTPSPDDGTVDPAQPTDGLKIYTKTQGVGKTGLYYVNSNNVRDELISKNRSLLLSMIF